MLNKAMHKTRLTQNMKAKHTNNAKTKTKKGERKKRKRKRKKKNHLEPFSFYTLEEFFRLANP